MSIEKWSIAPGESRVIDLELVRRLKVGLIGGKVDLIAHDEPGARVEVAVVTGKELAVSIDGDVLEIDHPQLRWDNFLDVFTQWRGSAKTEVSILAPRHALVKLGIVSGDALVSGFVGDAKLSTVSGRLVVDDHTGDIELSTVSGEVSAGAHTGRITAHSVSGEIVASGDIVGFNADTVSGDMIVDALGTPSRIETNSVTGDLTVRYLPGAGARIRVNTVGGTLLIDDTQFKGMHGKGFEHSTGELAGTWLDLGANSVSGDISVMRREPVPAGAPTGAGASDANTAGDGASDADTTGAGASDRPAGDPGDLG